MKYKSKWQDDLKKKKFASLDGDITCDVLIIGGGLTGLTTAFYLDKTPLKVVLVERNYLGSGASGKSTAKINYLQDTLADIKQAKVNEYLKSQREAVNLLVDIINDNQLECDLEAKKAYLFGQSQQEINKIKKIEKILHDNGITYDFDKLTLFPKTNYSISVNDTYTFNPALYINELVNLIKKVKIYENTYINRMEKVDDGYIAYAFNNKIKAKKVVMASWYPFFLKPYWFPFKTRLEKSYLACFKTTKRENITGINLAKESKSFQFSRDYFIYLMNSRIICNGNYYGKSILEKKHPEYLWTNIDVLTNDHLPIVGKIDDNLYIATGYNTWGNTNATLAGKMISELILTNKTAYSSLFDPKRFLILAHPWATMLNGLYSIKGYLKHITSNKERVYYFKDKAIYVSSTGKHYVVKRKCPHMKCDLIFNYQERTWDCPCHGSRFDLYGNCIFGPSDYNVKIDNKK